jgi:hypothetical protein
MLARYVGIRCFLTALHVTTDPGRPSQPSGPAVRALGVHDDGDHDNDSRSAVYVYDYDYDDCCDRHCTDSVVAWWLSVAGADEFAAAHYERCDNARYNGQCSSGPDYADSQRSASDDGVGDNDNVIWEHDDPYDDKHHDNDDDSASNDHHDGATNDHNRWEHRWHRGHRRHGGHR